MNGITLYGYPEYHESEDEPDTDRVNLFGYHFQFLFADGYEPTPPLSQTNTQGERQSPISAVVKGTFLQNIPGHRDAWSPGQKDTSHNNYQLISSLLFLPGHENSDPDTVTITYSKAAMLYQAAPGGADFVLEY